MLSAETQCHYWQFDNQALADPDLIDTFALSLCDVCGIAYPHYSLQLLISELISNAIDHGVLSLSSQVKDCSAGFESYLIERATRLKGITSGSISINAEWVGDGLLRLTVQDSGSGFDPRRYDDSTGELNKESHLQLYGRGLMLVRGLCRSVAYNASGSCTVVEFDTTA